MIVRKGCCSNMDDLSQVKIVTKQEQKSLNIISKKAMILALVSSSCLGIASEV